MKSLILGAAGLVMLAGCAGLSTYVSPEAQACIVNTGIAMQADEATVVLRSAQKAALIADACGISVDEVLREMAEAE